MALPTASFDGHEIFGFAAVLDSNAVTAGPKAAAAVRHWGGVLQTKVKANAQGRPGPNMQTGDYNRSIELLVGNAADGVSPMATVGTNEPQGRRLELGFEGEDSLGRIYHQPPFPHFGPAVDEVDAPFTASIAAIPDSLTGAGIDLLRRLT